MCFLRSEHNGDENRANLREDYEHIIAFGIPAEGGEGLGGR